MSITSINGLSPNQSAGNASSPRPQSAPENDAELRANAAAAQGSGIRPQEAKGVTNTTRNEGPRERNREEPNEEQVKSAVEQLNAFIQTSSSNLQFSVDKESGMRIIKVVDPETNKVIRQMPSEEAVEIAKAIGKLQGLLIRQTA